MTNDCCNYLRLGGPRPSPFALLGGGPSPPRCLVRPHHAPFGRLVGSPPLGFSMSFPMGFCAGALPRRGRGALGDSRALRGPLLPVSEGRGASRSGCGRRSVPSGLPCPLRLPKLSPQNLPLAGQTRRASALLPAFPCGQTPRLFLLAFAERACRMTSPIGSGQSPKADRDAQPAHRALRKPAGGKNRVCAIRLRFFPPAGFHNALPNPVRSLGFWTLPALVIGAPFSDHALPCGA